MFTKEDYQSYFSIIDAKEREMVRFLSQALPRINDARVRKVLEAILKDENRHCKLAKQLSSCLDLEK
ncbi:MAG: hypothetical protein PHU64_00530 [Candidatus Omnitrophica bacterium]|nr:hypothetical protein [Candidatus Omnitrophota bacterium]MDD5429834.1 hypothetical protein [Candidatus Omnitrophota bacterium]